MDWVVLGRVNGLFGVKGWVKVFSDTQPREGIIGYKPLYLGNNGEFSPVEVEQGKMQGKGVVLKFSGIEDRDIAAGLIGQEIAIRSDQLPPAAPGEYYWSELVGMKVVNLEGADFGTVQSLFETGANDVLVAKGDRERLIPFLTDSVIASIDRDERLITVDWDEDF